MAEFDLNQCGAVAFCLMAESFGTEFTIVEVTSDDSSEPTTQIWVALAKPAQALTLVLAAVPEGWTANRLTVALSESEQRALEQVNLKPGEVYKLTRA
jgi:hypothetical protein